MPTGKEGIHPFCPLFSLSRWHPFPLPLCQSSTNTVTENHARLFSSHPGGEASETRFTGLTLRCQEVSTGGACLQDHHRPAFQRTRNLASEKALEDESVLSATLLGAWRRKSRSTLTSKANKGPWRHGSLSARPALSLSAGLPNPGLPYAARQPNP